MLVSLHIENIAVIEKADVVFDSGFTVLTGETGAGKSMVIDALSMVLGERVSRDIVRSGTDAALVTAVFDRLSPAVRDKLSALGYEPEEDGTLLITRQISSDGRGSCRIGGRPATVSLLRELGRMLVNIHGQHENQALLAPERHVEYLDRLGGLVPQREAYTALYRRYCALYRELRSLNTDEEAALRRQELLAYQVQEIDAAGITAGEETALEEKRRLLRSSEKIRDGLTAARQLLCGDEDTDGGLTLLGRAVRELSAAGKLADTVLQRAQRLETLTEELTGEAELLEQLEEQMAFSEEERDAVEQRADLLHRLCGKYGGSTEAVLAYADKAREELGRMESADQRREQLEAELEQAGNEAMQAAAALTEARRIAGERFAGQVAAQLRDLDMPDVRLTVTREPVSLTASGGDAIEFCLSANPGEPPRPLAKIASGGEISRIMLAIKAVMTDADEIDTLIFDEVDTGVSGRAARRVGAKMQEIARQTKRRRQILCVTHLAQIAARADRHLLVCKAVQDGRTRTEVHTLDRAGREQELARIIGGMVTASAVQTARELLDQQE